MNTEVELAERQSMLQDFDQRIKIEQKQLHELYYHQLAELSASGEERKYKFPASTTR